MKKYVLTVISLVCCCSFLLAQEYNSTLPPLNPESCTSIMVGKAIPATATIVPGWKLFLRPGMRKIRP